MKFIHTIKVLSLSLGMLFTVSSCYVFLEKNHDNGKRHKHQKSWPKKMKRVNRPIVIIQDTHPSNNGKGHKKHSKKR